MSEEKEPRRRFLRQVIAIVPATTMATTATLTGGIAATVASPSSSAAEASSGTKYSPTYFTAEEWAFVNAAVDHLIPADSFGAGALDTNVPEFLDRQMETPYGHGKLWYMQGPFHPEVAPEFGHQINQNPRQIYRNGIAECNAWCKKNHDNKVFADLDKATQLSVLKAIDGKKISFDTVPAKMFFSYLLTNAKEGYFADPIYGGNKDMGGWKMVGFPGARADYADWIDQPNVKYPYGPVSISGQKG